MIFVISFDDDKKIPVWIAYSINHLCTLVCITHRRDPRKNLGGGGTVGSGWREFDVGGVSATACREPKH